MSQLSESGGRTYKIEANLLDLQNELREGDSLLDVGCYLGDIADFCEDYTGVDINVDSVEMAKSFHPKKNFYVGDVFSLEGAYDVVFCSRVLIHLPDFEKALKRL